MFDEKIKSVVKSNLELAIKDLFKEHPDIRQRLNIPLELYSIDDELLELAEFKICVSNNRQLIRDKYKLLIKPRLQIIEDAKLDMEKVILLHFFEDFYEYAVYKCVEADDWKVVFETIWEFFQQEIFASENKFELQARLKNLIYHGGIGLENIIPWDNVDAFWASSALDYRMLGWERRGALSYQFMDFFQPSWMVLRKRASINSSNSLARTLQIAEDQFNLFTFAVRSVVGGDVYFNDMRVFGLGHFSPDSTFGASWHPIKDNDIYEEFGENTTLENPWDWSISKVLEKCSNAVYREFSFADWHLRLNNKFNFPFDEEYSDTRKRYYLFERILNSSFVFNSLLPDIKNNRGIPDHRKNADLRENYLPEILSSFSGIDKQNSQDTIKKIYNIRNKIAHGKSYEAMISLNSLGSLQDAENKIHFFNYIVSRMILLSLTNQDLKTKVETYYTSQNVSNLPALIQPFS